MFCDSCGKQLKDGAAFCNGCGSALGSPQAKRYDPGHPEPLLAAGQVNVRAAIGQEIKAHSRDVWAGLKQLAASPVGGLSSSYQALDPQRALGAAIGFTLVYLTFSFIATSHLLHSLEDMAEKAQFLAALLASSDLNFTSSSMSFGTVVRLLFCQLVPVLTLTLAAAAVRLIFRGKGTLIADFYIASASLLPLSIALLLGSFIGIANIEVMLALMLFAIVYSVLMLYAGCSRISEVPEAGAAPAVPIMLIFAIYLTKVAVSAVLL